MTRHKIGLTLLTQLVGLLENKLHIYSRQMTNQTTKCKQIVRIEREINLTSVPLYHNTYTGFLTQPRQENSAL